MVRRHAAVVATAALVLLGGAGPALVGGTAAAHPTPSGTFTPTQTPGDTPTRTATGATATATATATPTDAHTNSAGGKGSEAGSWVPWAGVVVAALGVSGGVVASLRRR